ncbi:OstA-like protein [Hymenobacter seoulensis]
MSFPKPLFLFLLLLLPSLVWAQQRPAARPAGAAPVPQKGQQIELLGAGQLEGGTFNGIEIRKLIGNVSFRQGTTLLYCDSAYQYTERNALEAFSNVRIIQNDTITITGDQGTYDGDTRKARMTGNVTMRDPRMTLTTQLLDYDLNRNTAYYSTGGHLQDPENTLDSRFGYYNTQTKVFSFKRDVKLVTRENTIDTDTLQYNTVSKIAYFFGPTRIKGKQGSVYAENGNYNTVTKVSNFARNAKIETPNYLLGGDKLFYDEARQYGLATGNVSMTSKKDNIVIRGDVGKYWRADGRAKVYGNRAVMRNINDKDTLYLAADTLVSLEGRPPQNKAGVIYAYRKVRIFRTDLQGRCDSLTYDRQDSIIYLSHDPVLWNNKNQLTADSMQIQQRKGKIDQMRLYGRAFTIGQDTLLNFNQVKGRTMVAYFGEKSIKKIDVVGNAESIYYALEGDTAVSGVNKSLSATMTMRFAQSKLQNITFRTNPEASFIPPNELKAEEAKLTDFRWRATERPTRRQTLGKHFAPPAKPKKKAVPAKKAPVKKKVTAPKKAAPATPKPAAPSKQPVVKK